MDTSQTHLHRDKNTDTGEEDYEEDYKHNCQSTSFFEAGTEQFQAKENVQEKRF